MSDTLVEPLLYSSEIPVCYFSYQSLDMHPFLEESKVLQLVIDYVGFSPSVFYLKECSHYLNREVSGVICLNEDDYFEALDLQVVHPKYLKLEVAKLSDSLISKFGSRRENGTAWSVALESVLQGRPFRALYHLERTSLKTILECSVLRMNQSIFDIAIQCLKGHRYEWDAIFHLLRLENVRAALMQADAIEILREMDRCVPLCQTSIDELLLCASKFSAPRCFSYISDINKRLPGIDRKLQAHAHAGDSAEVRALLSTYPRASVEAIKAALHQAVRMRHLDVAAALRVELKKRHETLTNHDIEQLVKALSKPVQDEGPSMDLVTWLFEGVRDITGLRINESTLLEFACDERFKTMCHYLIGRGCTGPTISGIPLTLGRKDLFDLVDLCCGFKKGTRCKEEPPVELFLLKRGIFPRGNDYDKNPVIEVLWDGFRSASFSNRIELIEQYLMIDSSLATKMSHVHLGKPSAISMTPLGTLEQFGTPETEIWTGKNVIKVADFLTHKGMAKTVTDEWRRGQPDETNIQALQDITTALVKHGADPGYWFERGALIELFNKRRTVSIELLKRIIQGRADVHFQDENGNNPLKIALRKYVPQENGVDIIRNLLDAKADPYFIDGQANGATPLSWVFESGLKKVMKIEVADILFEYRIDINARDESGRTAIFRAIARDDLDLVDWLIDHGANLNLSSRSGVRPIDIARFGKERWQCSNEMVRKIEQVTGETDERDIYGLRGVWDLFTDTEDQKSDSAHSDPDRDDSDNEDEEDYSDESDDSDE